MPSVNGTRRLHRTAKPRRKHSPTFLLGILEQLESRRLLTTFAFSLKHINEAGAGDFLVDTTGMRKYSEWQSPPITYWGPSTNGVEGRIVYKFPLECLSTNGTLLASSNAWDFYNEPGGYGRGASSLEVSADGIAWTSLRDSLEPRKWGQDWAYDSSLPAAVLGTSEIWVRMRFLVEGAPNSSYTDVQFGRSTAAATKDVFAIRVESGPPRNAPTAISLTNDAVAEKAAIGTAVGLLTTTDPDAGDTFTYAFVSGAGDTDNASFSIVDNELRATDVFDYENKNSYAVRIRTTDATGLMFDQAITISVTNVNEAPTGILLSGFMVPENAPIGTIVGTLTTLDPDDGDTFIYAFVEDSSPEKHSLFVIIGTEVLTAAAFDFEANSDYRLEVRGTDAGGLYAENAFTIQIGDVPEGPTGLTISNATVAEKQEAPRVVGRLAAGFGPFFTNLLVNGNAESGTWQGTPSDGFPRFATPGWESVSGRIVAEPYQATKDGFNIWLDSIGPSDRGRFIFYGDDHPL